MSTPDPVRLMGKQVCPARFVGIERDAFADGFVAGWVGKRVGPTSPAWRAGHEVANTERKQRAVKPVDFQTLLEESR